MNEIRKTHRGHNSPLANAEFRATWDENNLRYALGATPPDEAQIVRLKQAVADSRLLAEIEAARKGEEPGMYWCEACGSYHVDPVSPAHHAALRCFAPYVNRG